MSTTQRKLDQVASTHAVTQRGATLLEAIAFLGVSAIVVLGAVSMLSSAFSSADVDKATNELMGLRVAIKKVYANQGGYGTGDLISNLNNVKALPSSLGYPGSAGNATAKNTWGDVKAVGVGNSSFTITFEKVPKDACIALLMATGPNTWQSIKTNGSGTALTMPVNPSSTTACDGANNSNTITFEAI
ncbi:MAG: pilS [Noviherbaspirillum sp.]|nr:pilS [Noviherbaspirillum sp.]